MPLPDYNVRLVDTDGVYTPAAGGATGAGTAAAATRVTYSSDGATIPVSGPVTDAQLRATAVPVSLAADEDHIGEVGGKIARPSANFTRPADVTAYASGDLVANSTTAGSVTPLSFTVARVAAGSGMIRKVKLHTSSTSITTASFRLHFYTTSPTVTNGDNGAWLSNQVATYIGAMDVAVERAMSDGATGIGTPLIGSEVNFALPSGTTLFALVEARSAYTPTSAGVFTFTLEVIQN